MNPTTAYQRWTLAACVFLAVLLTAVSSSAIFTQMTWLAPLAVVVAVIVLAGALFRSLPRWGGSGFAVLVQFIIGAWAVLIVTVPNALVLGFLPTPGAFADLFALMGQGIQDIYSTTAPTPPTGGLSALLAVGFALLTMLIDGLVSDLRVPKVAGVLLLAAYLIPVVLAPRNLQWWHFVAIGAAFLLLLLTPYTDRTPSRGPLTAATAGILALVLGVGLPLALPPIEASNRRPLGPPKDLTVVNPFLDLKSDLKDRSSQPVLSYASNDPLAPPIRLTSVSDFDGRTWKPKTFKLDTSARANSELPAPPGLTGAVQTAQRTANFSVGGLNQQYLPFPYAPQSTEGLSDQWIYDAETLTIVGNGTTAQKMQYQVGYTSVEPTAAQLNDSPPVDKNQFNEELSLPSASPKIISETAKKATRGADTEWEKAAKLQSYLRSKQFSYSLNAPKEASDSAIADFLRDKRGYCVQFSGAMAAMARTQGIPARIGVGFTAGTDKGKGRYDVSMDQAHAWPELYFEGAGWVRFEPTPGGPASAPPAWTKEGEEKKSEPTESATPSAEPSESAATPTPEDTSEAPAAPDDDANAASGPGFPWWIPVVALLVIAALLLPLLVRTLQRSRRLREPLSAERVWQEVRAADRDFGATPQRSETVHSTAGRLADMLPADHGQTLRRIGAAVEAGRYGQDGAARPTLPAAAEVREALRELRRALAHRAGRPRALGARLWPRSLFNRR